ncbi:MAG: hypothetical protein RIQ89_2250 [Bacteroidota bacterium]|jgi:O-antigen/teichoic acid export membrane protein
MQKKFLSSLVILLFLNLLIKPFWVLGIEVMVQNAVGAEQYGFYYAIFNFSFLLNIFLDVGITNFNNKNIAQNNHLLSKHFASIVVLRFLLAVTFTLVTLIGGLIIGYTDDMMKMLIAVLVNQILISTIAYLRSNLAGLHLFKTDSIISVLDRLIMILICGALLINHSASGTFDIRWFIYAQTMAYFITALITAIIVMDKAKVRKLKWRWAFFMMILKKSYPYAILVLLMTFYNRIDGVMLERLLPFRRGAYEAGIYASAYRLLDASNMIAFLFAGLLLPIFARMLKLKESVEQLVQLTFSILIVPAFLVVITCVVYSNELMALLYKDHIEASAAVFRVLICCFVPIASVYIFGTLLTANGNLKQLNIMASAGMVINIILNIFLIPKMEALGAAISSFSTQLLCALAQVLMVQYIFKFKVNFKLLLSLAIFVVGSIGIQYYISNLSLQWMWRMTISIAICTALAFTLRLISIKKLLIIFNSEH